MCRYTCITCLTYVAVHVSRVRQSGHCKTLCQCTCQRSSHHNSQFIINWEAQVQVAPIHFQSTVEKFYRSGRPKYCVLSKFIPDLLLSSLICMFICSELLNMEINQDSFQESSFLRLHCFSIVGHSNFHCAMFTWAMLSQI